MPDKPIRLWRSPYSSFRGGETLQASKVYTQETLQRIADAGFTGVWIHAILRDFVSSQAFPGLAGDSAAHMASLREVIERAKAVGLKAFLYAQPPRGLAKDEAFWKEHPEARGVEDTVVSPPTYAMCTSTLEVKLHLRSMARNLAKALPGLGGLILITASEYMAHCYTRQNCRGEFVIDRPPSPPLPCERCGKRAPQEVVGEIVGIFHQAFREAAPEARVIAWNWSWTLYEEDPGEGFIAALPRGATLMADFERGGRKSILGKERLIDEYSLGYAGPSERFASAAKAARAGGMKVMAKLQLGTTHELATVPNLPLIGRIHDKALGMRRMRVKEFMGCWNFGNMLTANTAAFNQFMRPGRLPARNTALRAFARDYLPGCDAEGAIEAWGLFEQAMEHYPFSIPFLYYSPTNYALARPIEPGPLDGKPCGASWRDEPRGDDLSMSIQDYTLAEIVEGLGHLKEGWSEGVSALEKALASCDSATAPEELGSARAAYHSFRSAWNLYRAYALRKDWREGLAEVLRPIMRDELENVEAALPVVSSDPRLGFHSECQAYLYDAARMRKKAKELRRLLG